MIKCAWHSCNNAPKENPYRGHEPIFCSKRCKNKQAVDSLRKRRKQEAVDFLGGRCSRCGYNKSLNALQFHHIDPAQKLFGINRGVTLALEKIKNELKKCELLCANCHAEHHSIP